MLNRGNCHVSMFFIALLHSAIGCSVLRVFLHIVHLCVRDGASGPYRMPHMLRQRYTVAAYLPGAAIISREQKLIGAVAFRQAAGYLSDIVLGFGQRPNTEHNENKGQQNTVPFHSIPSSSPQLYR
jgi:hypothetical protein